MGQKWKRLLLTTMVFGLMSTGVAFAKTVNMNLHYNGKDHNYKAEEVKIKVDGKDLAPNDMPAVIIDGRTMLPMRLIAQELGCDVLWEETTKQAFVINDDYTISFTINSKTAYKNGEAFQIDVPAMIINDRTMLPVRALAKALDQEITWDDPARTVYIGGGNAGTPPEGEKPPVEEKPTTPTTQAGKLTKLTVPTATAQSQVFTIEADSSMYSYEEIYVDDTKVVLDFLNTKNGLAEKTAITNSGVVSAIRTAQHETNGVFTTRVVFDLTGKRGYTVTQSADKKKIMVTFEPVLVDEISLRSLGGVDRIEVSGDGTLGAKVSTLTNPQRIVIDIPNATSSLEDELSVSGLAFVTAARTGMYSENTVRIVLEVGQLTESSWEEKNGELTVSVKKSTLENMAIDSVENKVELKKVKEFNTGSVVKNDQYLNGYYELTLPGNFESVYGYGTFNINNDVLGSVKVETKNGNTVIRFNQKQIREYVIEETADAYVIYSKNPKEVYDKVLLLDAGHGASDPGAAANGVTEKNMNLTLAKKVRDNLGRTDIKVYMTRDGDTKPENNDRAKTANQVADLMVSIHMNSATAAAANGTETLYQVHSNDNSAKLTSKKAAEIMQSHVVSAMGVSNRGVKLRTDLLILNATTVPTVLLETCFISNPGDAVKINNPATQDKVAQAIADAIVEMMGSYKIR